MRLLFLARSYPPVENIASVRTGALAKHLAQRGWEVTVVTPDPAMGRGARTPHEAEGLGRVRVLHTGYRYRFLLPGFLPSRFDGRLSILGRILRKCARGLSVDDGVGWVAPALQACRDLTVGAVDLVMATGAPYAAFDVAAKLSGRLDVPYVLDYRDAWTVSPHRARAMPRRVRRKEAQLLRGAGAVTVVSESLRRSLDETYGVGRKTIVVTNGYDPARAGGLAAEPYRTPTLVYAGTLYPPKRVLTPLLRAMGLCQSRGEGKATLEYFGPHGAQVSAEAAELGVSDCVRDRGVVGRAAVYEALKRAWAAVVVTTVYDEGTTLDNGIITGKLFEPMAVGTPILLIAPDQSDARRVLAAARAGAAFVGSDIDGIAGHLAGIARAGRVGLEPSRDYAWPTIGERLDAALRDVVTDAATVGRRP